MSKHIEDQQRLCMHFHNLIDKSFTVLEMQSNIFWHKKNQEKETILKNLSASDLDSEISKSCLVYFCTRMLILKAYTVISKVVPA